MLIYPAGTKTAGDQRCGPDMRYFMRTRQRDMHNIPKRGMSISCEELETLKKSIKVSVLNELQAEIEKVSDQESLKDTILSNIRTELMEIPNPASLKASLLNDLKMELDASEKNNLVETDRRLRELVGIQDGLVRELLDQKMIMKKLRTEIENLTKKLEDLKSVTPGPLSPVFLPSLEDPLDHSSLSRKLRHITEFKKETPTDGMIDFEGASTHLPGTSAKVQLKLKEIEPEELDKEKIEPKCEYIIAESGDKRLYKGNIKQQLSMKVEPLKQQSTQKLSTMRQNTPEKVDFIRARPSDDYKCEYIIAEKASKKHLVEESVETREKEDAELIICSRKNSRVY
jgi:hypothetical protein